MNNQQWWEQNWISKTDSRLTEAISSYEKAVELLPDDRDVLNQALNFTFKARIVGSDVEYGLIDKWLRNHPDDVSAWGKKGDCARESGDFSVALEYYKKVIDLIKSFYEEELEDWEYDYEATIKVIKKPERMDPEHRSTLENALWGNFCVYVAKQNYKEMLNYFWELFYLQGNEVGIVNSLTYIILDVDDKQKKKRDLQQKAGFTPQQSERKEYQDWLITCCVEKLRKYLQISLKKRYGKLWWEKGVPTHVKSDVLYLESDFEKRRTNQQNYHLVNYLSVRDFHRVICERRNWDVIFKNKFPSQKYVRDLINNLANYRNDVKHDSRLLDDKQIEELERIQKEIEKFTPQ